MNKRFFCALVEALVADPAAPDVASQHTAAIDRAATFLEEQLASLPLPLRIGTRLGLTAFRVDVTLRSARGFCSLSREARAHSVERWAASGVTQCRQLFRALRNLALLPYHERLNGETNRSSTSAPLHSGLPIIEKVDILIIGSGAGGAVTALELATRGRNVLVIEEGEAPGDPPPDPGTTATMARLYRHRGMTPIVGHVPIAYVEGRCIGGSTEINSGFWHRPPLETVLRWNAQYDLKCAGLDELRPHWEWAEQMLGVGPRPGTWLPSTQVFADGARKMEWAAHEVPRTSATMSRSLIPRAVHAGARLMSGARVDRLDIKGDRAVAALVWNGAQRARIEAEHIVVCAGPTETPALLRRSGVTRNVGDSLRIHPMIKLAAVFPTRMNSGPGTMPLLQVQQFWPEMVLGGAYFSDGHLAMLLSDNWPMTRDRLRQRENMACYYVGVRGTGRGRVRPSRIDARRTNIQYELSNQDMWNLSRGVARLAAMLLEGGATEVLPAVHGISAIRDQVGAIRWLDDQLDGRRCSLTTVHAFSSCPIGERIDRCAADSFGKVHGFANLYINDASMIPDSPGVNPQGTIMTFARRNALHFANEH